MNMLLEREGCEPVLRPSAKQIARALALSKSSFLSLTATDNSYVQAGGGPGLFMLEHRDSAGKQMRAYQVTPVVPFPDGTVHSFSGTSMLLMRDEFFTRQQVESLLLAFAEGSAFPDTVQWRPLTREFARGVQ